MTILTQVKGTPLTVEEINAALDRRTLLAMAWRNEGDMQAGYVTSDKYAENCMVLAEKLGFGIARAALQAATDELLGEQLSCK